MCPPLRQTSLLPGKILLKGFTLIELLVTIAITLILMALIFAVGGRAVSSAHSAKCSSNMRQIGVALGQFSADNDGKFPGLAAAAPATTWDMQIMDYLDPSGYNFLGVSSAIGLPATVPLTSGDIFKCPADKGIRAADKHKRSYTIARWTLNIGNEYTSSLPALSGIPRQNLQEPARSGVLFEVPAGTPPGPATGNVQGHVNFSYGYTPLYLWSQIHRDKANMLFADGHMELIPRTKTDTAGNAAARYFPPESAACIAAGGPLPQ